GSPSNPSASTTLVPGRVGHGAVALPGGSVLIYGGTDGTSVLSDPAPQVFSPYLGDPGAFLPVAKPSDARLVPARALMATAPLGDGSALLAGGLSGASGDAAVIFAAAAGQD